MLKRELRDVLERWPQTAGAVDVALATPGFSGASVLRVAAAGEPWCLRCWPTDGPREDRIAELHRWLAFLAVESNSPVPVPAASTTGATTVRAHGALWQLEPWLPGVADFHQRPTELRLRNVCVALARLHLAAERYVPTATGAAWFWSGAGTSPAVLERRNTLRQLMATPRLALDSVADSTQCDLAVALSQALANIGPRILTELEAVAGCRGRVHPCLRDVWHDHILFTGDEVSGIIDPSAARTENVASDLSRLLGSLLGEARERWQTALDAYSAVRPLSADERRLIVVLDRSGVVLSAAHWLARMPGAVLSAREWERVRTLSARVFALL